MNERDRLDELSTLTPVEILNDFRNRYYNDGNNTERGIVANAINDILPRMILPPCKVGDTVYCIEYKTIREAIVKQVKSLQDEAGTKFFVQVECDIEDPFFDDKRKTKHGIYAVWGIVWGGWHRAFSTREEAEAALAEREKK